MQSWKLILLGVGIGLGLGIGVIDYVRYTSKPKPWNTAAITVRFRDLDTGDGDRLVFSYIIQNNTDKDYRVNGSVLTVAGVLQEQNSLSGLGFVKFRDESIFIPAGKQGVVALILPNYRYRQSVEPGRHDERAKALASYVDKNLSGLNGFAAYDAASRYQINFPNGWHHGQPDNH